MGKLKFRQQEKDVNMKLYNHPVSPFTRLCQVVINLTKTECESQDIDLFSGEQKQDWYKKINPKGRVPALEMDDGTSLTESTVIAKYILRKAGGHAIYPDDDKTQAKIDEAICDVKELEWAYFPMTKFFGKPESEEGLKKVEDSMAKVSDLCFKNGNTWVYGDSVTLADLELAIRVRKGSFSLSYLKLQKTKIYLMTSEAIKGTL